MPLGKTDRADGHRGRRRVLRAGAVLLALLILVGVPGYLTTRPGFFGRYPALAKEYKPWSTSTHVEAGCEECHVSPKLTSQAIYRVRTVGEFYRSLIPGSREPKLFGPPTNAACLVCHSDLRSVSPEGDLKIPHRAHVSILKMNCIECHNYLVHELSPEGKHTPPMTGCLRCHDGDTAKNACSACHTEKAAPASHSAGGWLIGHASKATDPACAACHKWKANWCVDCHAERPRSHGADWRATHGVQVKVHRSCEACHAAAFCVRCHGEVPKLNFNPTLKLIE